MAFDLAEMTSGFIGSSSQGDDKAVDVISFCNSRWGLGMKIWPTQRFIMKCYYGMELDNTVKDIRIRDKMGKKELGVFTEKEFLNYLWNEGRVNTKDVEGKSFYELVLVIGRRGTKSTLATMIALYEVYKLLKRHSPQDFYKIHQSAEINVTSVSTAAEQASKLFGQYLHYANFSDFLRTRRLGKPSSSSIRLTTDFEKETLGKHARGTVFLSCGGCSAKSLRGLNNIVVILDELAHFIDNGGRFSGDAVYDALTPSVSGFGDDGKIIAISSPSVRYGIFWDLFNSSFESETSLMFKMPCTFVHPYLSGRFLQSQYKKDPDVYDCEYGAEFSDRTKGWIKDERVVKRCARVSFHIPGSSGRKYYAGSDLGVKNNGTALAVVHKEDGIILLDKIEVYYAGLPPFEDESILDLREIAKIFAERGQEYPYYKGVLDQWNGAGFMGHLLNERVTAFELLEITNRMKAEMFQLARTLIYNRELQLYMEPGTEAIEGSLKREERDNTWDASNPGFSLVRELCSLEERTTTRGSSVVSKTRGNTANDDASDALVRAVWLCHNENLGTPGTSTKYERFGKKRTSAGTVLRKRARAIRNGDVQRIPSRKVREVASVSRLLRKLR